jgi:hypothetical protein
MKKLFFASLVMFLFLNAAPLSAKQDRSEETKKFITMLQSSSQKQRVEAAKRITRSGLSDPRLFNLINKKVLDNYNLHPRNQDHIDEMAWMCKALASSGSSEYKSTLKRIIQTASSTKLKRYAEQSLKSINEYAQRNRLMKRINTSDPSLSPEVNRYIGMLKSKDPKLKKDAAKSIFRGRYTESKLFNVVNEVLLQDYKRTSVKDKNGIDTVAWLCKALGASRNKKYSPTLERIIRDTKSSTLKRHAKKSLGMIE